ncbi:MAG: beta-N-acetylhexosaminidase [Acidobacteria bacterium]|nr:beta-N-acetylhexosaminidase [Acidobacteriota bacterium]
MLGLKHRWLCSLLILLTTLPAWGAHAPLLPKVQKAEYREGSLPVAGLKIKVVGTATAEDRFAAGELQRRILARTGIQLGPGEQGVAAIRFERSGAVDALPAPGEKPGPGSREAYQIDISATGIKLTARSSAGIFYAVQTLVQLVEFQQGKAVFPLVHVEDWPALAYRGTMVDMSEGQLATEDEVKRQLDTLALWKANQYYFYNENSIELDGYPLLNPSARLTKDAIRRIIAYGRERHIDVVPCLELYGHQHDLFRIEKYSQLADFPHGGEFDPANPAIRQVLSDWIDQYLALFPSKFAHIGFDETWEIARAARVQKASPAKLFLEQIRFVAERFQAQGKQVLAWGDIMVKFPDIAAQMPKNIIVAPWWYEADPDPEYKKWLDPLVAQDLPTMVTPGVHMWDEISPDFEKTFRNIDTFLAAGRKANTLGLINAVWSDSQQGLRRPAWPGMAYGAVAAWQEQPVDSKNFFAEYATIYYRPQNAAGLGQALADLSASELALQKVWGKTTFTAVWLNPFAPEELANLTAHREDLRQARLLAEDAQEKVLAAIQAGEDPLTLNSLLFVSRMLDYAGMRGLYAVEISELWQQIKQKNGNDDELWDLMETTMSNFHGRVGDLLDTLTELRPEYRENWLAEYTSFRLEPALQNWTMEAQFWWRFQRRFFLLRQTYKTGQPLPALDVLAQGP